MSFSPVHLQQFKCPSAQFTFSSPNVLQPSSPSAVQMSFSPVYLQQFKCPSAQFTFSSSNVLQSSSPSAVQMSFSPVHLQQSSPQQTVHTDSAVIYVAICVAEQTADKGVVCFV
jgi:hypothetical protein